MNGRLVSRRDISLGQEKAMLELMQEHFDGVTAAMFRCDLAEKNWVILLEDDLGRLRGFSTLLVYDSSVVPARIVYSGDTIVDRDAWGSPSLAKTWIRSVRELGADYWLLITSGFRTYRFLSVFWREFWPRHDDAVTPPLLDRLARERFGDRYANGIVRFPHPQRLRGALADIPNGRDRDPHVAFFAGRNPGWAQGDELACVCPLSADNLTRAGERMVRARVCAVA